MSRGSKCIRSVHLPAYYLFPLVAYVLIVFRMSFKFYELNKDNYLQTLHASDVVLYSVVQLLSLCPVCFVHMGLSWLLCYRRARGPRSLRLPTLAVNLPFLAFYVFLLFLTVFHAQNVKKMQSVAPADHFETYVFRSKPKYDITLTAPTRKVAARTLKATLQKAADRLGHQLAVASGYAAVVVVCAVFLVLNWRLFIEQFVRAPAEAPAQGPDARSYTLCGRPVHTRILRPRRPLLNPVDLGLAAGALADLVLFVVFMTQRGAQPLALNRYQPPYWPMWSSNRNPRPLAADYREAEEQFRAEYPGRRYLSGDYPLVSGTEAQYCSYHFDECAAEKKAALGIADGLAGADLQAAILAREGLENGAARDAAGATPDLLVLICESLSPLPKYANQRLVEEGAQLSGERPYNDSYLPNLNAFSRDGITALGVSSAGLPTVFGWFGLMTSEKPLLNGINIVSSVENDAESFIYELK